MDACNPRQLSSENVSEGVEAAHHMGSQDRLKLIKREFGDSHRVKENIVEDPYSVRRTVLIDSTSQHE